MSFKIVFLCAQAFLLQSIAAQCLNNYPESLAYTSYAPCSQYGPGPYGQYAAPASAYAPNGAYNPAMLSASNGGGLAVASSSPIAPVGVSMTSENAYEGPLAVSGQIPFLGAVGVEGPLPTAGAGAIQYSCGNGNVAMLAEDLGYGYGAVAQGYAPGSYGQMAYAQYNAPYGACYN
ncbi:chorion class B protein PC10-like [Colias croceus]|uniref:chorion class B protein PC10-like n=1 Tax=Colias crocea TaxID=72248 RepID=UPI001E27B45C|nr:chorion class B protein PC10-like [Colias croceus]